MTRKGRGKKKQQAEESASSEPSTSTEHVQQVQAQAQAQREPQQHQPQQAQRQPQQQQQQGQREPQQQQQQPQRQRQQAQQQPQQQQQPQRQWQQAQQQPQQQQKQPQRQWQQAPQQPQQQPQRAQSQPQQQQQQPQRQWQQPQQQAQQQPQQQQPQRQWQQPQQQAQQQPQQQPQRAQSQPGQQQQHPQRQRQQPQQQAQQQPQQAQQQPRQPQQPSQSGDYEVGSGKGVPKVSTGASQAAQSLSIETLHIQPKPSPQQSPSQKPLPQAKQSPVHGASPSKAFSQSPSVASPSVQEVNTLFDLIPCRKNPNKGGTKGRPITVETNMMSINFGPKFNPNAVHYDITFNPDRPKALLRPVFEEIRKRFFGDRYPAFDGRKNVFSAGNLPFGQYMSEEVTIHDREFQRDRQFTVSLNKVANIDLSWLKQVQPGLKTNMTNQLSLQVIDVVLRYGPALRSVTVGRSFFQPPQGRVVSLTGGLELWVGMFQSAVLGWKPYLNVDVAHKGFPVAQNVIDLMKEVCRKDQITSQDVEYNREQITKFLKGLKVVYEIPNQSMRRTYRVNGLVTNAKNSKFKLDNGNVITIEQYFAQEKHYKIQYTDLPCLWVGSRDRQVYVPAELCTIVRGQVTMKKMDENQTSNMIKAAATNTDLRKQKIMNAFSSMNFNENPSMREFGISVAGDFEKVPARVLEPPTLLYDRTVRVNKGVWRASKFNNPITLEDNRWTILNLNERYTKERELYNLHDELRKTGSEYGMTIGKARTPFKNLTLRHDTREIQKFLMELKQEKLQLVVVVVPDFGNVYSKVKQVAELQVGVLTQCVRSRTVNRLNPATTGNILLKINSKLNGVNHTFDAKIKPPCLQKPCIIIGADVTHPSPDAVDIPSIAAVAASHDPKAFMYNIMMQLQPPRTEIILNLESIIRQQMLFFYKKTGYKPQRIIFYRDGVSEGQFAQVMHSELKAIKRACQSLAADYKPPITFLVVQKRHHVRLFPTDKRNSDDRNFNVQAGTVVDTRITHPSHIDFYLVSHASIQGTARPTKYRCLWDDMGMSEDEIEELTYYLCHMFSRCTRSVSYPTPTYYAHLAAYRARVLTQEVSIDMGNLHEEQRRKLTLNTEILGNPMFFV